MLELFPAGGLTSSVITTVWVGICIVTIMNLRFGTPLSGLVIPGYLVPLLVIKPVTAYIILVEAIITFAMAHLIGRALPNRLNYAEMFGRDRFFIIVLCSVLVRVFMDGFLLPSAADYLSLWDITFSWSHQLYSLGLVIIALTANVFWNGGFRYGATVVITQLILTFWVVVYLLTPLTNFSLTNLSFIYEDVAISIIAGPKAYIILLITAFIASRLNLRYGWEFNGILIPALLALQLFVPQKLIITLLEAVAIYFIVYKLSKTELFKRLHIEGAREIFLFFNIGFVLKILLGHTLYHWFPDEKINDYYGFGYMLSALLSLKMYQKGRLVQITRSTLQTTVIGGMVAVVSGFIIHQVFLPTASSSVQQNTFNREISVASVISGFRAEVYHSLTHKGDQSLAPDQLESLVTSLYYFEKSRQRNAEDNMQRGVSILENHGFIVESIGSDVIAITTKKGLSPFLLLYRLTREGALMLSVPFSIQEKGAADIATVLFDAWLIKILLFDGEERFELTGKVRDPYDSVSAKLLSRFNWYPLQVRQIDEKSVQGGRSLQLLGEVDNRLPIARLRKHLPEMPVLWGSSGLPSMLAMHANQYAELLLDVGSIRKLMAGLRLADFQAGSSELVYESLDVRNWIIDLVDSMPKKGSNTFEPWEESDLVLWDIEVLQPLLSLQSQLNQGLGVEDVLPALEQINYFLQGYNYQVAYIEDSKTSKPFLVLRPSNSKGTESGWGVYFFSLGKTEPLYIQAPHPIYETDTELFAYDLLNILNAQSLSIAGAHPLALADGQADVVQINNKYTLFNSVHQALVAFNSQDPALVVQVRSHRRNLVVPAPTILAYRHQYLAESHRPLQEHVRGKLRQAGIDSMVQDGSKLTAGFEVGDSAQSKYLRFSTNTEMATLWLSPDLRSSFKQNDYSKLAMLTPRALGPELIDFDNWISSQSWSEVHDAHYQNIVSAINAFLYSKNILHLSKLVKMSNGFGWDILYDERLTLYFLALRDADGSVVWLFNPSTFFLGLNATNYLHPEAVKSTLGIMGYMQFQPDRLNSNNITKGAMD